MINKWLGLAGLAAVIGLALSAACTLDNPEPPALSGPSELGTSIEMRAVPDQLVSDGFSSSIIEAVVRDASGERAAGRRVEFDIRADGAPGSGFLDLGNLAPVNGARPAAGGVESGPVTALTGSGGVARARYWAPFRTDQANDTTVTITGREVSTNFANQTLRSVSIFLRAADRPRFPGGSACDFILEPGGGDYAVGEQIFFTATQLTGSGGQPIARYEWDLGDGSAAQEGRTASRIYTAPDTYTVTLFTTESITGNQAFCTRDIIVTIDGGSTGGGGGGGGSGGGGPPGQTLFSFTSTDVPKGANSGMGCPNGRPCIFSTVDTSGVTGTIVFMRFGFGGTFADTSDTSIRLTGPGHPGVDERASFDVDGVGPGFGSGCTLNPRGSFTGPGATTFDEEAPTSGVGSGTTPYDASYRGGISPGLTFLASQLNANPVDKNGTFTLEVARWPAGGITTETLDCWTLEIWTVP